MTFRLQNLLRPTVRWPGFAAWARPPAAQYAEGPQMPCDHEWWLLTANSLELRCVSCGTRATRAR